MITEFRRLVFSNDELRKAIETFDGVKASKLTDGDIDGITINKEPEISVTARMQRVGSESEPTVIEIDGNYVAAAMLFYCSRCQIPLPKAAEKTLEIVGDCLALSLSLNSHPRSVKW